MRLLKDILGHLTTWAVVAALVGFVVYSLYFYHASATVACSSSTIDQQFGVAVHVVRQWFGKESQTYTCSQ